MTALILKLGNTFIHIYYRSLPPCRPCINALTQVCVEDFHHILPFLFIYNVVDSTFKRRY